MKKSFSAFLVVILAFVAAVGAALPVGAQDFPSPPSDPQEPWQPPYGGEQSLEPPVRAETYGQTWPSLQISPPEVAPGTAPAAIVGACLVNSYGHILTNLYRNWACYLIVSVSGPGYFYLWEYYPPGTVPYGHWLCYRWYIPRAGVWQLGPFVAEPYDPPGRYVWRMWFLSGAHWSTRSLSFTYTATYYPPDIPAPPLEPVTPPVINSFTASKTTVEAGETVVLNWTTTNASSVTISPGVGTVAASGSTSVTPFATTTYTLVAKGKSDKTASSSLTITVNPRIPPALSADPAMIKKGKIATLSWNAPGAVRVAISGIGSVGTSGTLQVSPQKTTTYTLTAAYVDGSTQSVSVTVTVEQPPYLFWGLMALLGLAAVAIVVLAVLLARRRARVAQPVEVATEAGRTTQPGTATPYTNTLPATTPLLEAPPAKLVLPDGSEVLLAGNARSFGRQDFQGCMLPENAGYISRQHFNIWYENGKYYIEDRSSTNGTKLNGKEIKGTGRHALADGDVIELAGKLSIAFKKANKNTNEKEVS
jgi:hypothetical protein